MSAHDCNRCLKHYQDGFDAGVEREQRKYFQPEILLTYRQLEQMSLVQDARLEGRFALTVFHHPDLNPTDGYKSWQLSLKLLTDKLGTRVTKIIFSPTVEVETYSFGLVED